MSTTPNPAEMLDAVLEYRLGRLRCALPGIITSYDASTQLADVQPCIREIIDTEAETIDLDLPVISGVPIKWPSGGGYFLSFPLAAGDTVELVFHDFSLDEWIHKGGKSVDPKDVRRHQLSDATGTPGLYAQPHKLQNASASKMVLGKDGDSSMQITIDGTTIKLGDTATDFVALAAKVLTELSKIQATLLTGTVSAAPGPVTFGSPYTASSVAGTKVKSL